MTLDRPERLKAATPTLLEALGKRWIAPLRRPLGQTYSPETVAGSAQALTQQLRGDASSHDVAADDPAGMAALAATTSSAAPKEGVSA